VRLKKAWLGVLMTVAFVAPAMAQAPVVGVADPEALFSSPDPKLHANKQVALHIVRDLLEANHWETADQYIAKDYIQHNPNVASGLDQILKYFGSNKPTPIPDRRNWNYKIVSVVAEGDLVTVAFAHENRDPRDPSKTYTTTSFDMWRIRGGKAVEHWDSSSLAVPSAAPVGR
jgi:predicted SnoaL-like aldol condensation-catalyzing enzyme